MKLVIVRDQDRGLLGGISFILKAHVELDGDEAELIKKYKVHKQVLISGQSRVGLNVTWTIGDLVQQGISQKCKEVSDVINTEETLKEVCGTFKNYLTVMASFGGEEVIEF